MKILTNLILVTLISIFMASCFESKTENKIEDVGEKIEETTDDALDGVEDAAEDAADNVEDAAESINN